MIVVSQARQVASSGVLRGHDPLAGSGTLAGPDAVAGPDPISGHDHLARPCATIAHAALSCGKVPVLPTPEAISLAVLRRHIFHLRGSIIIIIIIIIVIIVIAATGAETIAVGVDVAAIRDYTAPHVARRLVRLLAKGEELGSAAAGSAAALRVLAGRADAGRAAVCGVVDLFRVELEPCAADAGVAVEQPNYVCRVRKEALANAIFCAPDGRQSRVA